LRCCALGSLQRFHPGVPQKPRFVLRQVRVSVEVATQKDSVRFCTVFIEYSDIPAAVANAIERLRKMLGAA
jgi:hypothetical protein